jgi:hypothetical protein
MSEIADILDKAADLLAKPGVWGRAGGQGGSHCAATAIGKCSDYRDQAAINCLAKHLGVESMRREIWRWNDDPSRTLDDVLTALREAAAKARGQS